MKYILKEGSSYWDSTYINDDLQAVEWGHREFTNIKSAKEQVKIWAYINDGRLSDDGLSAVKEYVTNPEREIEEGIKEVNKEWCRIEKKE